MRWNVDFADIYEGDDSWAYLSLNIARGHERDDLLRQWDQEMKDGLPPNELLNCLLEVARSMVVRRDRACLAELCGHKNRIAVQVGAGDVSRKRFWRITTPGRRNLNRTAIHRNCGEKWGWVLWMSVYDCCVEHNNLTLPQQWHPLNHVR